MGALLGNPPVHRQYAEQGQRDDQQCGDRRDRAGGEDGDRGKVRQGGEVVDARQGHHLPPGMLRDRRLLDFRAGGRHLVLEEPSRERRPRATGCRPRHAGRELELGPIAHVQAPPAVPRRTLRHRTCDATPERMPRSRSSRIPNAHAPDPNGALTGRSVRTRWAMWKARSAIHRDRGNRLRWAHTMSSCLSSRRSAVRPEHCAARSA